MVHNNKVLTVSYGTFSCTLEGFEDSFGTMKAIAEYFRDLAADDRYFGAEPPQPDAEMLARIAEREIARQVEARTDTGGIVLKAAEIEDARAEPVEEPEPRPAQHFAPAPEVTAPEPAPEAVAEPEPVEEVGEPAPEPEAEPVAREPAQVPPVETSAETPTVHAEVEVLRAEVSVSEPVQAETEGAEPEAPAADSIAAKLQRIRAVVSQNDQASAQEEYTEDEFEAYAQPSTETLLKATIATAAADEAETGEEEGEAGTGEEESAMQDLAEPEQTNELISAAVAAAEPEEEAGEEEPAPETFETAEAPEPAEAAAFMADEDETASEEDELINILGDDEYDDTDPASARLVKVRRSELEAAVAAGELEEITDDEHDDHHDAQPVETDASDASPDADIPSSLSDDDEAELLQELAEVEAEMAAGAPATDGTEEEKRDAPFILSQSMQEEEADVSRLMAEAEEKMDDPEGSSRRQTYDHLRAAVAAKQADEAAAAGQPLALEDDPYRSDLADVVRPRRPAAGEVRDRRPDTGARPAPLKLVAEQRVDQGVSQVNRGSVRPRRVTTVPLEDAIPPGAESTEGSFAEFAEQMGAVELPDLLEAAAAYLSFVEGREKFSRPQLMNKVRQLKQDEFNREDGLRSFGQLLRDGKIEKTGGGRFTATGDLGFRPDGDGDSAREAG